MWHVASPRAIMLHCHLANSRRRQRRCLRRLSSHAAACSMRHAACWNCCNVIIIHPRPRPRPWEWVTTLWPANGQRSSQLQLTAHSSQLSASVPSSHLKDTSAVHLRTPYLSCCRHLAFRCCCCCCPNGNGRKFAFCQVTNVVLFPFSLFPIFLPRLKPLSRLLTAALMAEIYRQQQIEDIHCTMRETTRCAPQCTEQVAVAWALKLINSSANGEELSRFRNCEECYMYLYYIKVRSSELLILGVPYLYKSSWQVI